MSDKKVRELIGVNSIEKFEDILKIRDFCFSVVPWTPIPYEMSVSEDLWVLCQRFIKKEIGGWCGLNATFFQRLLWTLYGFSGVDCAPFDYGNKILTLTHITLIVKWENKDYIIDPYFCRHYTYKNGAPIELKDLVLLLFNRDLNRIHETFGEGVKYVSDSKDFFESSPQQLLQSVEDSWNKLYNYKTFMLDVFNSVDSKLLMLLKILKK